MAVPINFQKKYLETNNYFLFLVKKDENNKIIKISKKTVKLTKKAENSILNFFFPTFVIFETNKISESVFLNLFTKHQDTFNFYIYEK